MPGHGVRFCTRESNIAPFHKYLKGKAPANLCIGLRADEERVGNTGEGLPEGIAIRYPLREMGMTRRDVVFGCAWNTTYYRATLFTWPAAGASAVLQAQVRGNCDGSPSP